MTTMECRMCGRTVNEEWALREWSQEKFADGACQTCGTPGAANAKPRRFEPRR